VCAALTRDGRSVALVSADHLGLVHALSGAGPSEHRLLPLSAPKDADAAWADLAAGDPAKAYRAMTALVDQRAQAIALLKERLQPAAAPDAARIARLIEDLDSANFATRSAAMKQLEELHELAEDALEAVLRGKPTVEVRRRVQQLLDRVQRQVPPPERLRVLRAVEVLEAIGSDESRRLLEAVAAGRRQEDGPPRAREARRARG